ncbi:hypothetical protein EDC01DRAFT_783549 [Geopyxis carbonaria]|nr:hypothetical protein EDC01DRAFT_783549 [Geopyxis carbonaria]
MHSSFITTLAAGLFITSTLADSAKNVARERHGGFPPDLNFKIERRQFRPDDGTSFPPGFPFASNNAPAYAPGFPFQNLDGDSHAALGVIQKYKLKGFCEKLNKPSNTARDPTGTQDQVLNVNENQNSNKPGVTETSVSYSYSESHGGKDGDANGNVNVNSNSNSNNDKKILDEPVAVPVEDPVEKSVEESIEKPVDEPIEEPVEEPESELGREGESLVEKRQSTSYSNSYSSGDGNANVNIDNNNNNGHSNNNYNINGVEVPKELEGFRPATLSSACSTYLSGGPPAPGSDDAFSNVYYGYATAAALHHRLTPGLEPESYSTKDFDDYRTRCGDAAAAKSEVGAFVVQTDFETNRCYLATGGGVDAKRDLKDDKTMKNYLEAWNKVV